MKNFLASLLSRKFLAAMGGAYIAIVNKQYDVAAGIVAVWIAAEAHVDAKAAAAAVTQVAADATKVADATVVAAGDPRFQ